MDSFNNDQNDIGKQWLKELTVSIMQDNFEKIEKLTANKLPQFSSIIDMNQAKYLLKEAMILSIHKRNSLEKLMINVSTNLEIAINSITTPHHKLNKQF